MKRILILALAAAVLLCSVPAMAVDFEATGSWRVGAMWLDNLKDFNDYDTDGESEDDFLVRQRARTYFTFKANENLKGVLKTEIGWFNWGNGAGQVSGDSTSSLKIKNAYIDFLVPNTELSLRAGLQGLAFPSAFGGSPFFNDDVTALVANYKINDMVGITAGWARLDDLNASKEDADGSKNYKDEFDLLFATVPVTMDGMSFEPYLAYAMIGGHVLQEGDSVWTSVSNTPTYKTEVVNQIKEREYEDGTGYWVGIPFTLDMFDPLGIYADIHYGSLDMDATGGNKDVSLSGWLLDLAVDYKLDFMTPQVFFSWSNGVDKDDWSDFDGSKEADLSLYPTVSGLWAPDAMLFDGGRFGVDAGIYQPVSMWTAGVRLNDISFIDKMTHNLGLTYAQGTTEHEAGLSYGEDGLLNDEESFVAVDFNTKYMVYENLAALAEVGYMSYDKDDKSESDSTDDAWKLLLGLSYDF